MAQKSNPRHNRARDGGKKSFRDRAFSEKFMAGCGIIIAISMVLTTFVIVGTSLGY